MSKITKKKVVKPQEIEVVEKLAVNVEYTFTTLPYGNGNLNRQEFILFSTILHNLKDKGDSEITLTASELSKITGEVRKERIHKNLFALANVFAGQTLQYDTTENGKKYINVITLFDKFKFEMEYSPNFKLEVSISKSFLNLLNDLGRKGIRYFDYDINTIKTLPNRTFDNLLYVFLCAEAIKSRNGVLIKKEDFSNKLGIAKKQVENGEVYKRFLLPAIEAMEERGLLKKGSVIIRKGNGDYEIKYILTEKQESLF